MPTGPQMNGWTNVQISLSLGLAAWMCVYTGKGWPLGEGKGGGGLGLGCNWLSMAGLQPQCWGTQAPRGICPEALSRPYSSAPQTVE